MTAYPPFYWLAGEPVFLCLSCCVIFHPFRMGISKTPGSIHAPWRWGSIIRKKPFPSPPVLWTRAQLPPRSVLNCVGQMRRGVRMWLRARRPQGTLQLNTSVFPPIPSLEASKVILKVTGISQLLVAAMRSVWIRLLILLVIPSVVHVTEVVVITGVTIATYAVPSPTPADHK